MQRNLTTDGRSSRQRAEAHGTQSPGWGTSLLCRPWPAPPPAAGAALALLELPGAPRPRAPTAPPAPRPQAPPEAAPRRQCPIANALPSPKELTVGIKGEVDRGVTTDPSYEDDPSGLIDYLGDVDLNDLDGGGAVDHLAFRASDPQGLITHLNTIGIPYRQRKVPEMNLFQLFLEDPNNITLELNYFE